MSDDAATDVMTDKAVDAPVVDEAAMVDEAPVVDEATAVETDGHADVQPVALAELVDDGAAGAARDIGLLAGIEVEVSVELGRSRLPIRRLLSLSPGAVVELDRAAGTTVDILVNGTAVARGEVVVVDGDFGVRVTELVPRA